MGEAKLYADAYLATFQWVYDTNIWEKFVRCMLKIDFKSGFFHNGKLRMNDHMNIYVRYSLCQQYRNITDGRSSIVKCLRTSSSRQRGEIPQK